MLISNAPAYHMISDVNQQTISLCRSQVGNLVIPGIPMPRSCRHAMFGRSCELWYIERPKWCLRSTLDNGEFYPDRSTSRLVLRNLNLVLVDGRWAFWILTHAFFSWHLIYIMSQESNSIMELIFPLFGVCYRMVKPFQFISSPLVVSCHNSLTRWLRHRNQSLS